MKKKYHVLMILFLLFPLLVSGLEYPKVDSKMIEIYDLTDKKILYEIDSNEKTSIASLTKIATTITAIENIENLEETVTITRAILNTVSWDSSIAGLKVGDRLTYKDLLYASILPSGADATNAIAILSSGSIDNFVEKMNQLVEKIGLTNTHFVNVTGLDIENHYSTADDIRKLLEYSLKNELFKTIYTTKQYTLTNGKVVKSTLYKYGADNSSLEKIIGSKTGFTGNAGYCLSSLSNINGHEMLIIVLNAEHKNNQYYNITDTVTLIDFMNQSYQDTIIVEKDQLVKTLPVYLSNISQYEIYTKKEITKYLPIDYDKNQIKIEYKGLNEISYKNKQEEVIGKLNYYYGNELIDSEEVVINTTIKLDYIKFLQKYYYVLVIIFLVISSLIVYRVKRKKRKKKIIA